MRHPPCGLSQPAGGRTNQQCSPLTPRDTGLAPLPAPWPRRPAERRPSCRYRAFRGEDALYSPTSWNLLAIRLAFIIVFEVLGTWAGWSPTPIPPARTWKLALPAVTWSDAQSCGPHSSAGLSPGVRPPECSGPSLRSVPWKLGVAPVALAPAPPRSFLFCTDESRGRPRWARVLPRGCPLPSQWCSPWAGSSPSWFPTPGSVEVKMKREHPLAKQALAEKAVRAPRPQPRTVRAIRFVLPPRQTHLAPPPPPSPGNRLFLGQNA